MGYEPVMAFSTDYSYSTLMVRNCTVQYSTMAFSTDYSYFTLMVRNCKVQYSSMAFSTDSSYSTLMVRNCTVQYSTIAFSTGSSYSILMVKTVQYSNTVQTPNLYKYSTPSPPILNLRVICRLGISCTAGRLSRTLRSCICNTEQII